MEKGGKKAGPVPDKKLYGLFMAAYSKAVVKVNDGKNSVIDLVNL